MGHFAALAIVAAVIGAIFVIAIFFRIALAIPKSSGTSVPALRGAAFVLAAIAALVALEVIPGARIIAVGLIIVLIVWRIKGAL
jgi:cytochrome c oxidase assembly factor CtaG